MPGKPALKKKDADGHGQPRGTEDQFCTYTV